MGGDFFYKVNHPKVISETIDGETIIINLENGNYYRLDEVGSDMWDTLQGCGSVSRVVSHVVSNYKENGYKIKECVHQFVEKLKKENLIVPSNSMGASSDGLSKGTVANDGKKPFSIPHLEKYEDMQALLLADPIHEVDETGWPNIIKS